MCARNLAAAYELLRNSNVDQCMNYFPKLEQILDNLTNKINSAIDQACPLLEVTTKKRKTYSNPWITKGLIKSINSNHKLYRKSRQLPRDDPKVIKYIKYRNILNKTKRAARYKHFEKIVNNAKGNSGQIWNAINIALGKTSNKANLPNEFKIDGSIVSDPKLIVNVFAKHYSTIGERVIGKIKTSTTKYYDYLKGNQTHNFFAVPTNYNEVSKILTQLKSKNSSG